MRYNKKLPAKAEDFLTNINYSLILVTTPEPTVRPPSRIAKRRPSSIAIGVISSTSISTLSPGIAHLSSLGKSDDTGNVSGSEVELGTVVVEERCMTSALFLFQNVNLTNGIWCEDEWCRVCREPDLFRFQFSGYHGAEHRCCRQPQRSPESFGTFRYR